jgi:cytochrome c
MSFAGINNDKQRADVIDWLHTLSDNPEPLPSPDQAPAAAAPAPAAAAPAAAAPAAAAPAAPKP